MSESCHATSCEQSGVNVSDSYHVTCERSGVNARDSYHVTFCERCGVNVRDSCHLISDWSSVRASVSDAFCDGVVSVNTDDPCRGPCDDP